MKTKIQYNRYTFWAFVIGVLAALGAYIAYISHNPSSDGIVFGTLLSFILAAMAGFIGFTFGWLKEPPWKR